MRKLQEHFVEKFDKEAQQIIRKWMRENKIKYDWFDKIMLKSYRYLWNDTLKTISDISNMTQRILSFAKSAARKLWTFIISKGALPSGKRKKRSKTIRKI